MKIHEYQAKELLRKFKIPVPVGFMTDSVDEIASLVAKLPTQISVVKAQIHAGGRGKGGGVKLAKSLEEAQSHAKAILGMQLVTHQTGPQGQKVKKILVEQGIDIEKEFYLAVTLDRRTSEITFIASTEGGMEIENVATQSPELIIKTRINVATGMTQGNLRKMYYGLGLKDKAQCKRFGELCQKLYKAYMELDCSLLEINPLVLTKDGKFLALDCKITLDDNALERNIELSTLRDEDEEDPLEIEAAKNNLNYIKLDGNVSCMVNGAGLAMATMDIIKHYGGEPANFLDVGGTANAERVAKAFSIITRDPGVRAILVNIFGGIVRCDRVATGIVDAMKIADIKIPLVVRLAGTNSLEAREILSSAGVEIISVDSLKDAAKKVVEVIQ
jgi:succinyl-CoA synthetase beta subunit